MSSNRPIFILFMGMSVFLRCLSVNHFHSRCYMKPHPDTPICQEEHPPYTLHHDALTKHWGGQTTTTEPSKTMSPPNLPPCVLSGRYQS